MISICIIINSYFIYFKIKNDIVYTDNLLQILESFEPKSKSYQDLKKLFEYNISAVSSSSVFIMKKKNGGVVINYPNYEEKMKIYGNM